MNVSTQSKELQKQTVAPVIPQKKLVGIMADKFNLAPEKLLPVLKDTCFKGATEEQMVALLVVANEYNLNPFTREIYAFPAKSGGIVPVVGIDGWLRIINEHPSFDGLDVVISPDGAEGTCTIYRKDRTHPTIITEYFGEVKRNTDNWEDMPKRMLRHKTIIQCARVAFSFSGIKDDDEATEIAAEVISSRPLPKMPMEKVEVKPEEVPTLEEVISAPREPGADD